MLHVRVTGGRLLQRHLIPIVAVDIFNRDEKSR
jgi:hypothetical protein